MWGGPPGRLERVFKTATVIRSSRKPIRARQQADPANYPSASADAAAFDI